VDPAVGATVGALVAVGFGRTVPVGLEAGVGVTELKAVDVGDGAACGGAPQALTMTMPSARASAP